MTFEEPFPTVLVIVMGTAALLVGAVALRSPERIQRWFAPPGGMWPRRMTRRFSAFYASASGRRLIRGFGGGGILLGLVFYVLVALYFVSRR